MPSKRNGRAAPAVAADRGRTPTANMAAAERDGRRRAREEPVGEQRAVRARQEVAEEPRWTWSSPVRTILLHGVNLGMGEMRLMEFVQHYLGRDYPHDVRNPLMDAVVTDLEEFVTDETLRRRIERLESFQLLRDAHQAKKDAHLLNERGIVSLRQWKGFGEKGIVTPFSQGILNAVRVQNAGIPQKGKVLTGLYESIYDAKWDYVVKSPKGCANRFWLKVKKADSRPPREWTDGEVDFFPPRAADEEGPKDALETEEKRQNKARKKYLQEDENNVKPTKERLVMKVLTSLEGWPYALQRNLIVLDCFVTKETERVWRVVQKDLSDWFIVDPRILNNPRQRILIGTPGIGKSMAAGSYLLYQLLRYDAERLSVVAYFIANKTYIFDKITKKVTVYNDAMGLAMVEQLARKCNGYTIYDCSKREGEPPLGLPDSWGTVVISSPNENNFKEWAKQKTARYFIMNCPEESDIKAMCAWVKRDQPDDLQNYWMKIKDRMSHVGPIPRFIFNDENYSDRTRAVVNVLGNINASKAQEYLDVRNDELWHSECPSHKIVKIVRLAFDDGGEIFYNEPICPEMRQKIRNAVGRAVDSSAVLMAILLPLDQMIPRVLEVLGVEAFMNVNFIKRVHDNINEFPSPVGRRRRKCVFQRDIFACPTQSAEIPTVDKDDENKNVQFRVLYRPSDPNFPVVDGFFFVEYPRKTIVGIQTTVRKYHHTTTGKVMALRERLRGFFNDWDVFSRSLSWEIVYVQHKDSDTMNSWQQCHISVQEDHRGVSNDIIVEHEDIARHWKADVHQYHLKISSEDIRDN